MQNSVEFYNDEFDSHVKNCRELLNYEVSHKIFDDKVPFVYSFIDRFKRETEGEFCVEI